MTEIPGALLPRLVQAGGFARIDTEPIRFDTGEPDMHPESIGALDRLAAFLVMQPAIGLRIVGHTDDRGPEWANDAVSAERAASVRDYLIGRGVAARRLAAEDPRHGDHEAEAQHQSHQRRAAVLPVGAVS